MGYRLLGGNGQLLPLPWNNITTLSVVFNQDVAVDTAAAGLALFGSPDLPAPASLAGAEFSYSSATHTAQWTFAAPLTDDKYVLEIPSAAVTSKFGMSLDGEWTTAASGFPSGDGTTGGDFLFRFNVLPGAVTQNTVVTGVDGGAVRMRLFEDTTTANYSPLADVNGDGAINSLDGASVRMELLQALPASEPQGQGSGGGGQGSGGGGQGSAVGSQGSAVKVQAAGDGGAAPLGAIALGALPPSISTPAQPKSKSSANAANAAPNESAGKPVSRIVAATLTVQKSIGRSRKVFASIGIPQRRLEALDLVLEEFELIAARTRVKRRN